MKKKVLLTGANGQLGSFLKSVLAERYELVCATRDTVDLSQPESIGRTVATLRPDVVINAAAYTAVDQAESDHEVATQVNALAVAELAKAVELLGGVFIHISTDYVFDGTSDRPYREDDKVGPVSVYGQTKLQGEQAALSNCSRTIVIRTSWVFSEVGHNFVKTIVSLSRSRPKLEVVDDQVGGPTYAGHLAEFIAAALAKIIDCPFKDWGIYHFCGYPYVTWYQFAKEVCRLADSEVLIEPVSSTKFPRPAQRPANSRLDFSKAQMVFATTPSDWMSGLKLMLKVTN